MNGLRKITWAGLLAAAILFTAHGSTEGGGLTGSGSVFTTPAQYREMVLATPSVGGNVTITSNVTITGNNAYNAGDNDTLFPSGRTVTLSPFKIAKYETTYELWYEVKQWATDAARGGNKYTFANAGCEGHDGTGGAPPSSTGTAKKEPITGINWRDAIVWCNAYSEMDGKEPVYYTDTGYGTVLRISTNESGASTAADMPVIKTSANGYRLPTEAQWEYAARGGKVPSTSGSFTNKWAGTNTDSELGNYAWYSGNSSGATHPVGRKRANSLGLYDMSGNVWELCWDWYSVIISSETVTDPAWSGFSIPVRIIRGGAWVSDASSCAVTYRNNYKPDLRGGSSPDGRNYIIGFRVVAP